MKKLLLSIVIIVVAIITIGFYTPRLVDWNQYRDELTVQASSAIGRQLEIKGDIKIAVLPSPVLIVNDVHVANVEGASDADMLTLESIEVHVALAPLLGRNVQITNIKLVNPVINMEFLDAGRNNFSLGLKSGAVQKSTNQGFAINSQLPAEDAAPLNYRPAIGGFSFQIDSFEVVNGTINYRNTPRRHMEKLQNINGRFRLASLNGPTDIEGKAVVREIPLSFAISVGQIVKGRTLPLSFAATIIPGNVKMGFTGSISNIQESPQIKGNLKMTGKKFGTFVSALTRNVQLPNRLKRSFGAQAKISMDTKRFKFDELEIQLEKTEGSGSAEVTFEGNVDANVVLSVKKIDLDSLLLLPSKIKSHSPNSSGNIGLEETVNSGQRDMRSIPSLITKNAEPFGLHALPDTLSATLNLSVGNLIYKNETIRQVKLNASLANKEITLSQMSALLPGNSDVALFGFVTQKTQNPTFDGSVDMTTHDLRSLLKWLGINTPKISKDRLRKLVFSSKLQASPRNLRLSNIKMRLDNTDIRGSTTIVLRDRPSIETNLAIDKINIDAYLENSASPKKVLHVDKINKSLQTTPNTKPGPRTNPIAALSTLEPYDLNFRAKINSLTLKGVPVSGVMLDFMLMDSNLVLNELTVKNLAGIRGKLSGNLSGLKFESSWTNPLFENFTIDAHGKSLARLFKLLEILPPIPPNKIGPVKLTASLNGVPKDLKIDANLKVLNGTISLAGIAKPLDPIPWIDGQVKLRHPDLKTLLRTFDAPYQPATKKSGSVNLSSRLTGSAKGISLNRITGIAGHLKLRGDLEVNIDGPRPLIRVNLATNGIDLNKILPRQWSTFLFDEHNWEHAFRPNRLNPLLNQASWQPFPQRLKYTSQGDPVAIGTKTRWSTTPIDFTFLNFFDADITLKTPHFIFNNFQFDTLILAAKLKNGILDVHQATGKLFGGDLKLNCKITALDRKGRYRTGFTLKQLDMPRALRSFGDRTLKSGTMEVIGDFRTEGKNLADFISRLNGSGSLSLTNVDVSGGTSQGSVFSSVTKLLTSLYQFSGSLSGKAGRGKGNLRGSFKIEKGVAKFNDMILTSSIGNGSARGIVDLPNWYLNSRGNLQLSKNFLMQVLTEKEGPQLIPFTVSGLLNKPNVALDTSKISSGGILIPGNIGKRIDKVLKKKGIGAVLEKILPTPRSAAPSGKSGSRSPQVPQQSTPPKPRPEELLKNLLKGLIR